MAKLNATLKLSESMRIYFAYFCGNYCVSIIFHGINCNAGMSSIFAVASLMRSIVTTSGRWCILYCLFELRIAWSKGEQCIWEDWGPLREGYGSDLPLDGKIVAAANNQKASAIGQWEKY